MAQMSCVSCNRTDVGEGRFCRWCGQMLIGPIGVKLAGIGQRLLAYILDVLLLFLTLFLGYLIWWLIVLARGQTPGKQLVGIRVWDASGTPAGWGRTFLREFIAKLITHFVAQRSRIDVMPLGSPYPAFFRENDHHRFIGHQRGLIHGLSRLSFHQRRAAVITVLISVWASCKKLRFRANSRP